MRTILSMLAILVILPNGKAQKSPYTFTLNDIVCFEFCQLGLKINDTITYITLGNSIAGKELKSTPSDIILKDEENGLLLNPKYVGKKCNITTMTAKMTSAENGEESTFESIYISEILILEEENVTISKDNSNDLSGVSVVNTINETPVNDSLISVKIGNQEWANKNLNVSSFRNGVAITEVKTFEDWKKAGENKVAAWCYYNFDPKNGQKYGKIYNHYAVCDTNGLAPIGWHVASNDEFKILIKFTAPYSAKNLKSTSGWNRGSVNLTEEENLKDASGTDAYGFNALPGGYFEGAKTFFGENRHADWWTSTSSPEGLLGKGWGTSADSQQYISPWDTAKSNGYYVRCIKDPVVKTEKKIGLNKLIKKF